MLQQGGLGKMCEWLAAAESVWAEMGPGFVGPDAYAILVFILRKKI